MNRKTIDFGIDLGTTNSEITCIDNGEIKVLSNYHGGKYTPSVVRIDSKSTVIVGTKAYDRLLDDPDNTISRFKRWMGTQQVMDFKSSGKKMSAEELSAEVLKELLRTAKIAFPEEEITAAVITVPCNFETTACEATIRAAKLAGIRHSPLLQEPIAASIAYGFLQKMPQGYWVVYDLGGGTFDVAVMAAKEGRLSVVDHCGDNYLGGTDFDWRIVEHIVYPVLSKNYNLPDLNRGNKEYSSLNAILKASSEKAKIELSHTETADIEIYSGARRIIDKDGKDIELTIPIKRSEYEPLIEDYVEKTLHLFEQALKNQGFSSKDMNQLILVGGPTLTPYIRHRLKERFNIPTEYKIDPLTVVAQGAAVFAAGQFMPDEVVLAKRDYSKVFIKLAYSPMTTEVEPVIGGKLESKDRLSETLRIQISRIGGDWQSGLVEVKNDTFMTAIILREKRLNTFKILLLDQYGNSIPIEPDSFSITQGISIAAPPLIRSIGVELEDGSFDKVLGKGTSLPVRSKIFNYFTTRAVRPGEGGDILNIHVWEGESNIANRNRYVGTLKITGDKVNRPLPENTEIDIVISVDQSRDVTAGAFISSLDQNFKEVLKDRVSPKPEPKQLDKELEKEEKRFNELKEKIEKLGDDSLLNKIEDVKADEKIEEVRVDIQAAHGGDQEAVEKADRRLKDLQIALDPLEYLTHWPVTLGVFEQKATACEEIVGSYGNEDDKDQLPILKQEAEKAIQGKDTKKLEKIGIAIDQLRWGVLFKQPGFWIGALQNIKESNVFFSDKKRAQELISEGDIALQRQDIDSIQSIVRQLWDLMPQQEQDENKERVSDSGIRKSW